jgi:nicotinamide-nucleotide amidase
MIAMFPRVVLPHIASASKGGVIISRTLHTFGLGESWVAEKLGALMDRTRNPSVGTTVSGGIVSLRVNARFGSRDLAQQQLDHTISACRAALGDLIFGEEDQTLASVVAAMLASSRKTVTTAESCTGGLLAKMLTDIPGSSDFFKTGFITYSNQAKHELLGVPMELINEHGAVSEPVVLAMAQAARERGHADFALAISGIAGPSGGSPTKPVGTVCIALSHRDGTSARTFLFPGDREFVRDRSAKMALSMLRYHLMQTPVPF